jgi:hypothetical protein
VQADPVTSEKQLRDSGVHAQSPVLPTLVGLPLVSTQRGRNAAPERQSLPAPDLITTLQHFNI